MFIKVHSFLLSLFTKIQQIYQKRLELGSSGTKQSYSIEHPQVALNK